MKLHLSRSIGSGRAHWMLEEVGAACEIVQGAATKEASAPVKGAGAPLPPSLPTLMDGGLEIGGWPAIVRHLAYRFPEKRLAPPEGSMEWAFHERAIAYVAAKVDPVLGKIPVRMRWGPEPRREAVIDAEMRQQLREIARTLEEFVTGRAYVTGEAFSAADVITGSAVAWLDFFGVLKEHPELVAYRERLTARPAYQGAFAPLIREATASPRLTTLTALRPGRAGAPLFFSARPNIPSSDFAALLEQLDTERPLYAIHFRYPEEPQLGRPYTREEYAAWARNSLEAMRSVQPKGPYLVVGMCEGAQIGYELARLVEAQGEEIALLGILDTWTPENSRSPLLSTVRRAELAVRSLFGLPPREQVKQVGAKAWRSLARAFARLGLRRPPAPRRAGEGPALDHVAAQQRWQERAHPKGPLKIQPIRSKITVFRASTQGYWMVRDRELGWGSRTIGGVEIYDFQGEHVHILMPPMAARLGEQLTICLRRLEDREAEPARGPVSSMGVEP